MATKDWNDDDTLSALFEKPIRPEEVDWLVEHIRTLGSDESSHYAMDALHVGVLHAAASGRYSTTTLQRMARSALKVQDFDFSRWYA